MQRTYGGDAITRAVAGRPASDKDGSNGFASSPVTADAVQNSATQATTAFATEAGQNRDGGHRTNLSMQFSALLHHSPTPSFGSSVTPTPASVVHGSMLPQPANPVQAVTVNSSPSQNFLSASSAGAASLQPRTPPAPNRGGHQPFLGRHRSTVSLDSGAIAFGKGFSPLTLFRRNSNQKIVDSSAADQQMANSPLIYPKPTRTNAVSEYKDIYNKKNFQSFRGAIRTWQLHSISTSAFVPQKERRGRHKYSKSSDMSGGHTCRQCGRQFRTTSNLRRHERLHSGQKPFQCKFCGRSFAAKYNKDRHERDLHSNNS